eukprot:g28804.t1
MIIPCEQQLAFGGRRVEELLLKLRAWGCVVFFTGPEKVWNTFDSIIILVSVTETIFEILALANSTLTLVVIPLPRSVRPRGAGPAMPGARRRMASNQWEQMDSSYLRSVRFIRVARALRGVRVIRLIHYIGALRTLVFSIMSTTGSLLWTLVLLVLVFYIFGVVLAQIVTDSRSELTRDHCRELAQEHMGNMDAIPSCGIENPVTRYWFGVSSAMFTLFMAISGGVSWEDALKLGEMEQISPLAVMCMTLFIIITVFAILNVVTGVFCNTAIESAHADRDIAIMKQMVKQKAQVEALQDIFLEIDRDESHEVSIDELKAALEERKLASFMESLDISTQDCVPQTRKRRKVDGHTKAAKGKAKRQAEIARA